MAPTVYYAYLKNISDVDINIAYDGKASTLKKIAPGETISVQFSAEIIPVFPVEYGFDHAFTDETMRNEAFAIRGALSDPPTYYLYRYPPTPTAYIGTTPVITLK